MTKRISIFVIILALFCSCERPSSLSINEGSNSVLSGRNHWATTQTCPSREFTYDIGRCVYISIFNNTPYTLNYQGSELSNDGFWREQFPYQIPPNHTGRFAAARDKGSDFRGTHGWISYKTTVNSYGKPGRTSNVSVAFDHNWDKTLYGEGDTIIGVGNDDKAGPVIYVTHVPFLGNSDGDTHVLQLDVSLSNQECELHYLSQTCEWIGCDPFFEECGNCTCFDQALDNCSFGLSLSKCDGEQTWETQPACSSYGTQTDCNNQGQCLWNGTTCIHRCSQIGDQNSCNAYGCIFDTSAKLCRSNV